MDVRSTPRKRTSELRTVVSDMGHERTHALQQTMCAQTLSVYARLEVVGTGEKLRELIVFIVPDADTPLDKVRRGHALCCDGLGMTQDATQLSFGRASVYR